MMVECVNNRDEIGKSRINPFLPNVFYLTEVNPLGFFPIRFSNFKTIDS